MTNTFTYELRPGAIEVGDIEVVLDLPDVKILEVDLVSTYPGYSSYTSGGGSLGVSLHAVERTLYRSDIRGATEIVFTLPGTDWCAVSDAARYTWQIALYRRPAEQG